MVRTCEEVIRRFENLDNPLAMTASIWASAEDTKKMRWGRSSSSRRIAGS